MFAPRILAAVVIGPNECKQERLNYLPFGVFALLLCFLLWFFFFFLSYKGSFYSFPLKLDNVGNIISDADNEMDKNSFQFQSRDL